MSDLPASNHGVDEDSAGASVPARCLTQRFMRTHIAHFIALGFGSGLSPAAPGTAGTLWAWLSFLAISFVWTPSDATWGLLIGVTLLVGWWAATRTAQRAGVADPSQIVIDEIVAFWLVLWLLTPAGLLEQAAAFALFRFFDAVKPQPVRWADSLFKGFGARGGFGILFDDLVAAGCTLLVLALWRFVA